MTDQDEQSLVVFKNTLLIKMELHIFPSPFLSPAPPCIVSNPSCAPPPQIDSSDSLVIVAYTYLYAHVCFVCVGFKAD